MIIQCPTSSFQTSATSFPLTCPYTGAPLEFTDFRKFDSSLIAQSVASHWRYRPWLRELLPADDIITLGEGWTPLLSSTWQDRTIHWKMDSHMPTGSYKDRGVSVMINWFVQHGYHTVMDDSSGNAGASLACYAARAAIHARIFVPLDAPAPKKSQIATYGAELVEVEGPRHQASAAAEAAQSREVGYASHALHPAFLFGQMTVAWEIWEQLGGQAPTWLVAPVGNGGLVLGAWRGFQHLAQSGLIQNLPRLLVVQVAGFDPVYRSFVEDNPIVVPIQGAPDSSAAEGISIINPARGDSVLTAVYQSRGVATVVTNDQILQAQREMALGGIFVEPTSAATSAAITKHMDLFGADDVVVGILSGSGLKNPPSTL